VTFLSAVLIVKNEVALLPGCLASLRGVVDAVYVYDTGSRDGTVDLARSTGATVIPGDWPGDFAEARNRALALTDSDWVLSIDADERVVPGPDLHRLRELLRPQSAPEVFATWIHNESDVADHDHAGPRLFRRPELVWVGCIHEHPRRRDGTLPASTVLPERVLRLEHLGYSNAAERTAKSARNADLAQQALDRLIADPRRRPWELAHTMLSLGRARAGAGDVQGAHDAFVTLRDLFPESAECVWGTDALAQLLLTEGYPELVPALAAELHARAVPGDYCDWLVAQSLALAGRPGEALNLLDGLRRLDRLVDATGRRLSTAPIAEMYVLTALAAGQVTRALNAWREGLHDVALAERMAALAELVKPYETTAGEPR
jgi:hypothetical protein